MLKKDLSIELLQLIQDHQEMVRFIELLGTYNPCTNPAQVNLKEEEILKWLNNGAQPSDTVKNLLSKQGIMKKFADSKQGK